jgi:phosphate transport system substrate-binding protein
MILRKKLAAILALSAMALFSACGETGETPAADGAQGDAPQAETVEISVVGSTTVQPLAELLSEAYEAVDPNVIITVSGGGSSVGVKSASEQSADIGMASREIKDSEIEECPEIVIHTIAYDGIAIVTGLDMELEGLTMEQARAIFAGEITDWAEVGAAAGPITVVSREEGSGTRAAFEELVLGESLMSADAILQPSNGAVRTTVTSTPGAIAYISFGYMDDSTRPVNINGAAPSAETVESGEYPVYRPLNMVTYGEPEGAVAQWLDFIKGADGQAIVVAEGYLPIN